MLHCPNGFLPFPSLIYYSKINVHIPVMFLVGYPIRDILRMTVRITMLYCLALYTALYCPRIEIA